MSTPPQCQSQNRLSVPARQTLLSNRSASPTALKEPKAFRRSVRSAIPTVCSLCHTSVQEESIVSLSLQDGRAEFLPTVAILDASFRVKHRPPVRGRAPIRGQTRAQRFTGCLQSLWAPASMASCCSHFLCTCL